jgi:hypothetical protein
MVEGQAAALTAFEFFALSFGLRLMSALLNQLVI